MNKTYQFFELTVPANGSVSLNDKTRNDFDFVSGFFLYSTDAGFSKCRFSLRIDEKQIVERGFNCTLFSKNEQISRNDAIWKLDGENIAAKNSPVEAYFENTDFTPKTIQLYLLLKNETPEIGVGQC